jgi:hypothetical protein
MRRHDSCVKVGKIKFSYWKQNRIEARDSTGECHECRIKSEQNEQLCSLALNRANAEYPDEEIPRKNIELHRFLLSVN